MIHLILTFDYELPLGKVKHSYEDALFQPTEQLLELAQKIEVPIVLFADILSYYKHKESQISSFTVPFEKQLQKALQLGHEVQLHLHPHWMKTEVGEQTFQPDLSFTLEHFSDEELEQLLQLSIKELKAVLSPIDPYYRPTAYRAGGYNIQSKGGAMIPLLQKYGVAFDSSVAQGYYFHSAQSTVDFRKLPAKGNWLLPLDGDLTQEGNSSIMEVPIAAKPKTLFELPTALKMRLYADRAVNRGSMIHRQDAIPWKEKINMFRSSRMLSVDNFTFTPKQLLQILDYHIRKYKTEEDLYVALIGHPKSMGEYALGLLESFVKMTRDKYGNELRITTFPKNAN